MDIAALSRHKKLNIVWVTAAFWIVACFFNRPQIPRNTIHVLQRKTSHASLEDENSKFSADYEKINQYPRKIKAFIR